ncbi:MAG: hypothetical protein WDZ51_07030 [Pirellulaceae bacterium]
MRRNGSRHAPRGRNFNIHRCRGLEVLEPKLPLAGDMPLDEPLDEPVVEAPTLHLRYTFVESPTATIDGAVENLPASLGRIDEWSSYHLEVWVQLSGETAASGHEISFDLGYRTDLTSATHVQYGEHFTPNQEAELDDALGQVRGISVATVASPAEHAGHLLLARVRFETVVANGDNVRLNPEDLATGGVGPYDIELATQQVNVESADVTTEVFAEPPPSMKLVPVIYDLTDSHTVGLADFTKFISHYGQSVESPEDGGGWFADFNKDGRVGLADFTLLISHYGNSIGSDVSLPENYTEAWLPRETEGEPNVDPGGGGGNGGGGNPGDPPVFELDALFQFVPGQPGVFLPGADMVFVLLVGHINFQAGFDVSRLTAQVSMSEDTEEEEISVATLSIILEDEELYQTEIELVFEGELVDTLQQFLDMGGFVTQYTDFVMLGVRELLLDSFD